MRAKIKLNPNKHYINKSHTKHYYLNIIFTNKEWLDFIEGKRVHEKIISLSSKYRKIPNTCERWYNQDNHKTNIAKPCKNKPFYRSDNNGIFFCKYCAKEVSKINDHASFTKIKEE